MLEMRTIIFDSEFTGHHVEYISYLFKGAQKSTKEYVFLLNERLSSYVESWGESSNIIVDYLDDNEEELIKKGNALKKSRHLAALLKNRASLFKVDEMFFISFAQILPAIIGYRWGKIKLSGILYRIFLYEETSRVKAFINKAFYRTISHSKNIGKIFLLNDKDAVKCLNREFNTDKFYYLIDPVPDINKDSVNDVRESLLKASNKDEVFLHFGGLTRRKGTLDILDAIAMLTPEQSENKIFVFAGRIYAGIKDDFYSKLGKCTCKERIRIFDYFLPNEVLYDFCYSSDCILIPYYNTAQSSGVLGYASLFRKPVIGPSKGLLGMLIEHYNLGVLLDDVTPDAIASAILAEKPLVGDGYASERKVDTFISQIV